MTEETTDNGRFLELLAINAASGKSIRDSAQAAGCSERHGYRLAASDEFKRRVSEIRSEMTSQAVGELSATAALAVATVKELLSSDHEPVVRLNAAKAVLNALKPVSELAEIRERLAALEAER